MEWMAEPRERTGLLIPECSCRVCCEATLRSCAPPAIGPLTVRPKPLASDGPVWTVTEVADRLATTIAQLHQRLRRSEVQW